MAIFFLKMANYLKKMAVFFSQKVICQLQMCIQKITET